MENERSRFAKTSAFVFQNDCVRFLKTAPRWGNGEAARVRRKGGAGGTSGRRGWNGRAGEWSRRLSVRACAYIILYVCAPRLACVFFA